VGVLPTLFQIDVAFAELAFRGKFFVHVIVRRAAGMWKASDYDGSQTQRES
jgi:hypothetical protein